MSVNQNFNIAAYITAVIVYYFIGFVWYSFLFMKAWQKETGIKMESGKFSIWIFIYSMGGQLIMSFLYALGVYMVVMLGNFAGIKGALITSGSIIGFFVIPLNSANLLFANKKILFLIDSGYQSAGAVVMALILTLWR